MQGSSDTRERVEPQVAEDDRVPRTGAGRLPLPSADVYETAEEFVVEVDVPRCQGWQLEVDVAARRVTVSGTRDEAAGEAGRAYHVRDRPGRRFQRSFDLPADANADALAARASDGVPALRGQKAATPAFRAVALADRPTLVHADATPC